jgi:hypothetical protein
MTIIIAFHALMLFLVLAVLSGVFSLIRLSGVLGYLHKSIGITTAPLEQTRIVALVWIASVVVIIDGCLLLLVFITQLSHPA